MRMKFGEHEVNIQSPAKVLLYITVSVIAIIFTIVNHL